MGWFDNDDKSKASVPTQVDAPRAVPATPAPTSTARAAGSILGQRVHVNGTIVSEEDLTVLGRIDGTIQARKLLTIASDADVRAVIHGYVVHVEGRITGDVHATEKVILGSSAKIIGNISTPSLQVVEGAFFKGNVEMRAAEPKAGKLKEVRRATAPRIAPAAVEKPAAENTPAARAGRQSRGAFRRRQLSPWHGDSRDRR